MKKKIVARFDDSINTYDPSIVGIFLGNNNKSDESTFLSDESILTFESRVVFLEKN